MNECERRSDASAAIGSRYTCLKIEKKEEREGGGKQPFWCSMTSVQRLKLQSNAAKDRRKSQAGKDTKRH